MKENIKHSISLEAQKPEDGQTVSFSLTKEAFELLRSRYPNFDQVKNNEFFGTYQETQDGINAFCYQFSLTRSWYFDANEVATWSPLEIRPKF